MLVNLREVLKELKFYRKNGLRPPEFKFKRGDRVICMPKNSWNSYCDAEAGDILTVLYLPGDNEHTAYCQEWERELMFMDDGTGRVSGTRPPWKFPFNRFEKINEEVLQNGQGRDQAGNSEDSASSAGNARERAHSHTVDFGGNSFDDLI